MLTDKHGYPIELEVTILQITKGAGSYNLHTQDNFNTYVKITYGTKALEISQSFWRNKFFRVSKSNYGNPHVRCGYHGSRVELTKKGEEYFSNMLNEYKQLKDGGKQ
jgi:hypothetical protein